MQRKPGSQDTQNKGNWGVSYRMLDIIWQFEEATKKLEEATKKGKTARIVWDVMHAAPPACLSGRRNVPKSQHCFPHMSSYTTQLQTIGKQANPNSKKSLQKKNV